MAWIYRIVRISDGACYVGHTSQKPGRRWYTHFNLLKGGNHHSAYLQNAWRKHGAEAFRFEVIEECGEAAKVEREQFWIDNSDSRFNFGKVAGTALGQKRTVEQRARMAAAATGNQKTKGLIWSADARANMSKAAKGKPRSAAQRAAMLRSLELARKNNRVNKPGMNWRLLRRSEEQRDLFEWKQRP